MAVQSVKRPVSVEMFWVSYFISKQAICRCILEKNTLRVIFIEANQLPIVVAKPR